jgi:hypothetical protein
MLIIGKDGRLPAWASVSRKPLARFQGQCKCAVLGRNLRARTGPGGGDSSGQGNRPVELFVHQETIGVDLDLGESSPSEREIIRRR